MKSSAGFVKDSNSIDDKSTIHGGGIIGIGG